MGTNHWEGVVKSQLSALVHALLLPLPDSHPPCLLSQLDHHVTAPAFWDQGAYWSTLKPGDKVKVSASMLRDQRDGI